MIRFVRPFMNIPFFTLSQKLYFFLTVSELIIIKSNILTQI